MAAEDSGEELALGSREPSEGAEPDAPVTEIFIEVPKGSRNKYEYDHDRGVFELDRMLFTAVRYPGDYGFLPGTLARDGDALDAMVILGEPTFPGCHIPSRVVGMLDMTDDKGPDEKILAVPERDPRWRHIQRLADVPGHLLDEIAHFFGIYKDLERKRVDVHGWEGRQDALETIRSCRERHRTTDR